MANLYFTSPIMKKNKKIVAVAGKRDTLLGVALDNGISIPCECKNGECGSCMVKVTHLDGERVKAVALTEKEKNVLKSIGKFSEKDREKAEVSDLPPLYRLACQTIVTDEDLLIEFTGEPGGA